MQEKKENVVPMQTHVQKRRLLPLRHRFLEIGKRQQPVCFVASVRLKAHLLHACVALGMRACANVCPCGCPFIVVAGESGTSADLPARCVYLPSIFVFVKTWFRILERSSMDAVTLEGKASRGRKFDLPVAAVVCGWQGQRSSKYDHTVSMGRRPELSVIW